MNKCVMTIVIYRIRLYSVWSRRFFLRVVAKRFLRFVDFCELSLCQRVFSQEIWLSRYVMCPVFISHTAFWWLTGCCHKSWLNSYFLLQDSGQNNCVLAVFDSRVSTFLRWVFVRASSWSSQFNFWHSFARCFLHENQVQFFLWFSAGF